jgi:hypothetical protein
VQDRDVPQKLDDGSVEMRTRAELQDSSIPWTSRQFSARAAEFGVVYSRLKHLAVELTDSRKQPQTIQDAVTHVVATEQVAQPGGLTLNKYMQSCRKWAQAEREKLAAKAGEQAAVQPPEPADEAAMGDDES